MSPPGKFILAKPATGSEISNGGHGKEKDAAIESARSISRPCPVFERHRIKLKPVIDKFVTEA